MMPSSHFAPIDISRAHREGQACFVEQVNDLQLVEARDQKNNAKNEADKQATNAALLASEFSEFISAASRLESSYRTLQDEVSVLGMELSERNAALCTSLAENERMRLALQQIVDSMPCGVMVVDRKGKISMINPESRRLLGLEPEQPSEGWKTTLRQIAAHSGVNLEASLIGASAPGSGQEFCVSGNRWIEVCNRQLFHRPGRIGKPDQTILILRDITAQKRAESEREAGRKAMALAELTTILAHEIRNPLASLELFAELIEKDADRRGEWVSNLRAGIRSLSGTVNNVLSFHGSGSPVLSHVELSVLIEDALRFAQPLADQAAIELNWSPDGVQAVVMGNESALRQIVLNLVSNAIRYTPAGGAVTVSLKTAEDVSKEILVEFSDTGSGIRPDQIDHLFEPGFSGTGDTTGLGLAVCERIMRQHSGRITAENGQKSGARFTLRFPVPPKDQASQ